jgi:hypothetical protein
LVDWHSPDGLTAFAVRDGWIVPLRECGAHDETRCVVLGTRSGERAK